MDRPLGQKAEHAEANGEGGRAWCCAAGEALFKRELKIVGKHGPQRAENLVEAARTTERAKNGRTSIRKVK